MKNIALGFGLAVALAAPAFAFDNTTCKTYLAGTWQMEIDDQMGGKPAHVAVHSVYTEDGAFNQTMKITMAGMPDQDHARKGTWDAGPGATADTCDATLTPEGDAPSKITLTVIDDNNVKGPEGHVSTRVTE